MAFWNKKERGEIIYADPGQMVPTNKEDVVYKLPEPKVDYLVSYACGNLHVTGGEAKKKPDKFRVCQECGGSVELAVVKREKTFIFTSYLVSSRYKYEFVRFLDED